MYRKLLAGSLALALSSGWLLTPTRAEEGMWLPDAISALPLAKMRAKGFALKPEDIYNPNGPSLKDAIVIIDGGTGEFVSPEGLLLTNHHVAFDGIASLSTPEKDYVANGFVAKSRAEELPTPGYTVQVLDVMKDVTKEMLDGVTPDMSATDREKRLSENRKKLVDANTAPNRQAQVVEMNSGLQYYLYVYDVFPDVRMVYAPPKNIGYYGGDPDNFEWPRHCGDFTFFRVYADKNNRPAAYAKDNVPYRPKKYLTISLAGYKEGDFTMVMGYPGRTNRYREAASVETSERIQIPLLIDFFTGQIAALEEAAKADRKTALALASQIFSLSNSLKAYQGAQRTLRRVQFLERRRKEEAALAQFIAGSPANQAKYGDVIPKLTKLNEEYRPFVPTDFLLPRLPGFASQVAGAANLAVTRALEAEKPAAERNPQVEAQVKRVKDTLSNLFRDRNPTLERRRLVAMFELADKQPAGARVAFLDRLFEGKTGEARAAAQEELARRIVESPYYDTPGRLQLLFELSASQLRALDDPGVNFLLALAPEAEAARKRVERFNAEVSALRARYIEARAASRGTQLIYPDANRTLRFTYGEVKGYTPKDGAIYRYYTTLFGVVEKDRGVEPFDAPQAVIDLHRRKDHGRYFEPRFGDVPVNFLSTNDIIGGNSGSPILNGRGEMIGVVFDGNFEGLGNDFLYDGDAQRTISVDIRYVLFLTEKMAGADYLFKEMTFAPASGAAPRR
ncbi:MAG: S46 family peptidase [Chloracidobacterium sp.]|nr:S46 family peptidase [Chloracidobacterium sp.]MDW8216508.1 S46 family peptidase [Acidobacteriota bacterium]